MAGPEVYEFGEFILDVAERRLSKGGAPVPLEPKAHEVLLALVRPSRKHRCEKAKGIHVEAHFRLSYQEERPANRVFHGVLGRPDHLTNRNR